MDKLQKETTAMAVYKHLYHLIMTGSFQPGEWIRERQIKEILGVSSTPIREALKMLAQERLLEAVPHHGVRIKKLSMKEMKDMYELRVELEGLAAQLAAIRGTTVQFNKLEEILNRTENKIKENSLIQDSDFLQLNNEFHDFILDVSGNHALKNSLAHIRAGVDLIRVMAWKNNKGRLAETLKQHRLILYAIKARDPQLARLRVQEHIWDSVKMILQGTDESELYEEQKVTYLS